MPLLLSQRRVYAKVACSLNSFSSTFKLIELMTHTHFQKKKGVELMAENSKIFRQKWNIYLREKHFSNPWLLTDQQKEIQILKASDLRARDPSKANILYIDLDIPKNTKSRSYETLYLLSGLGHRITVVSYHDTIDEKCDLKCRDDIQKHGIEVAMSPWYELAEKRAGFYDTVIINQPLTFLLSYKELATLYQKAPFVLIYYFDTLQYPGYGSNDSLSQSEKEFMMEHQREIEYKLVATADIIVTSSLEDKKECLPTTQMLSFMGWNLYRQIMTIVLSKVNGPK